MNLETVFTTAPADCEEIRMSCRVYYKSPVIYILTGWLHVGSTWQRIEAQADQPEINQTQLDNITAISGWVMDSRPSRKSTTEFIYTFRRDAGDKHAFGLHSKTTTYVDRRIEQAKFSAWAGY